MARRKKQAAQSDTDHGLSTAEAVQVATDPNDVFSVERQAAEVAATAAEAAPPQQEKGGGYTGMIRVLPDGTKAHYRDFGNRDGVEIGFEFADDKDRPGQEVTAALKEPRQSAEHMQWTGKRWHKEVAGYSPKQRRFRQPVYERLDAEERFETAVDRLAESRKPKDEGRSV